MFLKLAVVFIILLTLLIDLLLNPNICNTLLLFECIFVMYYLRDEIKYYEKIILHNELGRRVERIERILRDDLTNEAINLISSLEHN